MKHATSTKESIMESAIYLFNTKGFDGVSIRDIAKRARINPANIAYYFRNKQGLLEACLIKFFESYLAFFEEEASNLMYDSPVNCLNRAVKNVLQFQSRHHLLTRFVWREVSLDSQVVREITSSYLMKERYFLKEIIDAGVKKEEFNQYTSSYLIIQLKGMINMPYLNSQYLREVWNIYPQEVYFAEKYYQIIEIWIRGILVNNTIPSPPEIVCQ
ncbi:forespore capture DNA-binding protein RefZ [Falsibacillus albus]|uniref:TetR/AcrR family transcriptional regulator n=1 Tax=Falsibacillus albus TaxID=2478915 RepID=A0A3L7K4E5_9BACI|nr:forespore capture DNA-binding protein RefZ [Falsibacillus albus]RLQ97923.1 TetR/AcrR family transcriptional regulator [Falsibacillus albus]